MNSPADPKEDLEDLDADAITGPGIATFPPTDPDVPFCRRHRAIGKPGEERLGWKCPRCLAESQRFELRRELKDVAYMLASLAQFTFFLLSLFIPLITVLLIVGAVLLLLWHFVRR